MTMKNDLSCEVVRDLLPSYLDGIASDETKAAVERHISGCSDCRETLRRMREPENMTRSEQKEIDYLKAVRRRSFRKVTAIVAAVVLLAMAVTLGVLYKGVPADPGAIAAVVTVRDGTVRLTGTFSGSGGLARSRFRQDERGAVEIKVNVSPLTFDRGDFSWENTAARDVTRVTLNGLVLWEDGVSVDWVTARLYEAKNPYVGDMSANAGIAALLRIQSRVGSYTNELQTTAEPYGWTFLLEEPVAAENERSAEAEMRRCSCVLLAEVENLGVVTWRYETAAGEQSFSVTAANATEMAGRDIKTCAGSAAALQRLLNILGF